MREPWVDPSGQNLLMPGQTANFWFVTPHAAIAERSASLWTDQVFSQAVNKVLLPAPWAVSDFVWNDLDGDGLQSDGEPGVAGVNVVAYDKDGSPFKAAPTDANGKYLIDGLVPGEKYKI